MITVEVSKNSEVVEIILDQEGLDELKAQIDDAVIQGDARLRSQSWAGNELEDSRASQNGDVTLAKELTIRIFQ